jgi:GLPGLI family protein
MLHIFKEKRINLFNIKGVENISFNPFNFRNLKNMIIMKHYILGFVFLFITNLGFCQIGLKVTYEEKQVISTSITELHVNDDFSIYKTVAIKGEQQNTEERKKIVKNMEKNAIYLVKNFKGNKILYPAIRVFDSKKQIISDSLNSIKWKIMTNIPPTKYLGRKVKMAKCRFRERNYTALYCPDIPISDGPFKFNGLPGLILKISSDDNFISFSATKIEFIDQSKMQIAPKYFNNQIPFWDYVKLAKKEMAEDFKQFLSTLPPDQRNTKFDVKLDRIEMVF